MEIVTVPLDMLVPDPGNARQHPRENLDAIKASLSRFGQVLPILVREKDSQVVAGNGTLEAMRELGWTEAKAALYDGDDQECKALAIALNRTAELAEWNEAALSVTLAELTEASFDGLSSMGFDAQVLDDFLAGTCKFSALIDVDGYQRLTNLVEDVVPEPPKDPVTRLGDIWTLGRHSLVCGDATQAKDAASAIGSLRPSLMVTDPPYGVEYDPEWRQIGGTGARATGKVCNDGRVDWREAWALFVGDIAYVWHAGRFASAVEESLSAVGFEVRSQIIWAKQHLVISRGHYHWKHEPCWYAVRKGAKVDWIGDRKQTTLWEIANRSAFGGQEDDANTIHGTQKPLECMARAIRNHSGVFYDPFLGSGTTLIAAEQLGRTCVGVELDPTYCDGIVERWENLTGEKAIRK